MIDTNLPPTLKWVYYIYDEESRIVLDLAYDNAGLILALKRIQKLSPTERVFKIVTKQVWMYNYLAYPDQESALKAYDHDLKLKEKYYANQI